MRNTLFGKSGKRALRSLIFTDQIDALMRREMGWNASRHYSSAVWNALNEKSQLDAMFRDLAQRTEAFAPAEFPSREVPWSRRLLRRLSLRKKHEWE